MSPKVIDLFAGAGGFSLGFEQEGFDIILANEYNPVIAAAYKENHKAEEVITGDIRALSLGDYRKIIIFFDGRSIRIFRKDTYGKM